MMKLRLAVLTATLTFGAPLASYADMPALPNQKVNADSQMAVQQTAPAIPQQMNAHLSSLKVDSRHVFANN